MDPVLVLTHLANTIHQESRPKCRIQSSKDDTQTSLMPRLV